MEGIKKGTSFIFWRVFKLRITAVNVILFIQNNFPNVYQQRLFIIVILLPTVSCRLSTVKYLSRIDLNKKNRTKEFYLVYGFK